MGGEGYNLEKESGKHVFIETETTNKPTILPCLKGIPKRERYLMLMLIAVLFIACLLAVSLVSLAKRDAHIQDVQRLAHVEKQTPNICLTQGCVKAASSIIEKLNETADPCNDFFEFACGNFVKNTFITDEKSEITMFSLVVDNLKEKMRLLLEEGVMDSDSPATLKAKNLYSSCMDTETIEASGLESLKSILKQLGGWPVLKGDSWYEENFSWIQVNYLNRKMGFSMDYLFKFSVDIDYRNSSWRIISLDQPSLGMSREYLMKGLNDSDVQAFLKYSIDAAVLLGAEKERAQREMVDVLQFQIDIANISLPREERRNLTKLSNILKLGEMNILTKDIPWVHYINTLLPYDLKVEENERIRVSDPNYFRKLGKLLEKTDKRVVSNYLLWRVAADSASYLSEDMRKLQLEYWKKLTGKTVDPPRWKECMGIVSSELPYAIGNLYLKNFFNEKAKAEVVELVTYVREEFEKILNSVDWMDETTRQQALQKSQAIRPRVAYPPEILRDEKLTEYYQNVTVDNKTLLDNIRRIEVFNSNYKFSKLREKVDKLDWKNAGDVADVNAYYNINENSIKIPAGILQGIFFEPDRPKYLNFGSFGFIIGHEITHGFDDQGKQFNAFGNLENWWQRETEERFLEKIKCIIYQYGNYTAPENGLFLDGINTQGENIADNGAIKDSYRAYQKWVQDNGREKKLPGLRYTPNQLFWISTAQIWCIKRRSESLKAQILTDSHSPGRFRVVGPLSNSEEFARDFSCPLGSRMNPEMKCSVW